jgi:HPt (histidine-containing phosphotransfer) domain-containing protein
MKKENVQSHLLLKTIDEFEADGQLNKVIFLKLIEETDEDTVRTILELFKQVITEAAEAINREKNDRELAFFSHKLKSSSRLLGFIHFSILCEQLENRARNSERTEDFIETYKTSIDVIKKKLNKVLK